MQEKSSEGAFGFQGALLVPGKESDGIHLFTENVPSGND
jgi:hypothetical protein